MLKQVLILTLLLTTLISCKSDFPAIKPQVRCVNVLLDEQNINGVLYYSGHCRCHLYSWGIDNIGRISESVNYDLLKCNKLIGFEPDSWTNIWTWWEEIRYWLKRQSKK